MISKKEFENYYHEYIDAIYNFSFYKLWCDEQKAYDISQEAFYKALKKLDTFDEKKSSFKTWIYTITHHLIIDYYRALPENDTLSDYENLMYYYDGIEDSIDSKQKLKKIYLELNNLSSTTKQIIILRIFEELSFQEISHLLDISQWACKMQFKRGIESIKWTLLQIIFILFLSL